MTRGAAPRPAVVAVIALLAAACGTDRLRPPETGLNPITGMVQPGRTTRRDLLLALGPASSTLDRERIAAWRIFAGDGALAPAAREVMKADQRYGAWDAADRSLVVVFDDRGVAQRFSLVPVK